MGRKGRKEGSFSTDPYVRTYARVRSYVHSTRIVDPLLVLPAHFYRRYPCVDLLVQRLEEKGCDARTDIRSRVEGEKG